mgnify:CR=1 FL=1
MQRIKIIAIVGPTASGKTSLGIWLAKNLPASLRGEIISADSRQVYKGLNIGTGKVTKKEMAGVPHHLLDVCSPKKTYTASDFKKDGEKALTQILAKNKVSIIVGGTGLYIDVLLGRIVLPDVPPNPQLRAILEKKSAEVLFKMLQKKDPRRAKDIKNKNEQNNKHRLVRALEIAEALGKSPAGFRADTSKNAKAAYNVLWLGLNPNEKKLKTNIRTRLLARVKAGMLAEAKRLHKAGLSYRRMEELGLEYRSLARLLQHKTTKEAFLLELERAIGQYAKRQLRWFTANKEIIWIGSKQEALKQVKEFLT